MNMTDTHDFQNTVEELFKGMNSFISSKTVVGEAVHLGDTIVLPLMDVTFGIGAGSNQGDKKNTTASGGVGGKMTPSALLVISNGTTKLVNIRDRDSIDRLIDLVPDVLNKFSSTFGNDSEGEAK